MKPNEPSSVPADPTTIGLLAQLDVPDHGADFWTDLVASFAADAARTGTTASDNAAPDSTAIDSTAPTGLDERAIVTRIDRPPPPSQRWSRLALLAVAAFLAVVAGYGLLRVGTSAPTNDPAQPDATRSDANGPDDNDPDVQAPDGDVSPDGGRPSTDDESIATTSYAHLGGDNGWATADDMVWAEDRFIARSQRLDPPGYWTSPDGIDWERHDGISDAFLPPWRQPCLPDFFCEVDQEVEPLPLVHAELATQVVARAGGRLVIRAWTDYRLSDLADDFSGSTLDVREATVESLSPDLRAIAVDQDPCLARLLADPEAGSISGSISGSTSNLRINLGCQLDGDQRGGAPITIDLNDYMTPAESNRIVNGQSYARWWVVSESGDAQPLPFEAGWFEVASTGERFWANADGTLSSSADGVTWETIDLPDLDGYSIGQISTAPGGHVAAQFWREDQAGTVVMISHDDGVSWSRVDISPADASKMVVGPAGVLLLEARASNGPGGSILLADDGVLTTVAEFDDSTLVRPMAVGDDRVIVQRDADNQFFYEVYSTDGSLLHRASPDIPSRWQQVRPFAIALGALAAFALALWRWRQIEAREVTVGDGGAEIEPSA